MNRCETCGGSKKDYLAECLDGVDVCMFCSIGDDLEVFDEGEAVCPHDGEHVGDKCPRFECKEIGRLCPTNCIHYR